VNPNSRMLHRCLTSTGQPDFHWPLVCIAEQIDDTLLLMCYHYDYQDDNRQLCGAEMTLFPARYFFWQFKLQSRSYAVSQLCRLSCGVCYRSQPWHAGESAPRCWIKKQLKTEWRNVETVWAWPSYLSPWEGLT
jgi:hypothetical protein